MDAIIYKTIDYKENDKLVYIITNQGKYSFILKNCKKFNSINRYPSEILSKIEVDENYLKKDKLTKIFEIKLINDYFELKQDFEKIKYILKLFELLDLLIFDNEVLIYNILDEFLKSRNIKTCFYAFLIKILKIQGLLINFYNEEKDRVLIGYNLEENQLVYKDDFLKVDFDIKTIEEINKLYLSKFKNIDFDIKNIYEIKKYIKYMYLNNLDIKIF